MSRGEIKRNVAGYLFISPWLIGFLGFIIGPMIASLYLSFTDYDLLSPARWIGLGNYGNMMEDSRFWKSLQVTLWFVLVSVPLKLGAALLLALLFNSKRKATNLYATVYYIPSILGGSVAVAVMWRQLFSLDGVVNWFTAKVGMEPVDWIFSPDHSLSVIILQVMWQFGAPMLIFLSGLKAIPKDLYEAASVDGANGLKRFLSVTLPMLTPVLLFNLVMQTIHAFLTFSQAYLITGGGPLDETLFYALYLYDQAFTHHKMGYASAMAWVLLAMMASCTALIFRSSRKWAHYES
ncbi:carbohydrate ABC transporter permease [Paenibacillus radicis (ex Xue et al. 2023)]|uniref:Sugar ABC transporter permease n=1 Tax=Paenibacillus radicis (ex Xue et al. 2023) TaxID=2972489 RepID=A0ABT1YER0_9BACL|nr:sugar ABC transporter permease [Paenibacillus radicis (ex Xue et al. 2023)]MCR8630450.1 sugar ABC transporter permease [Paenibacillus radicis (ex Xue et al. 2023)]